MKILYPSDYFKPSLVEADFREESVVFTRQGFEAVAVGIDGLVSGDVRLPPMDGESVLYRGWMLNAESYGLLVGAISAAGGIPWTSKDEYLLAHHLPNWVHLLQGLTPETKVLPNGSDFEAELRALGWQEFFIKDYVKSLKTSLGSRITDPAMIGRLVEEMKKFRGEIEGGLCVRRVESFDEESEKRFFVLKGEPFSANGVAVPPLVTECARRIESPFFSVDIAKNDQGEQRVVEIGDGQVSDLVGWEIERFVEMFSAAR